jgi:hypothetical protein
VRCEARHWTALSWGDAENGSAVFLGRRNAASEQRARVEAVNVVLTDIAVTDLSSGRLHVPHYVAAATERKPRVTGCRRHHSQCGPRRPIPRDDSASGQLNAWIEPPLFSRAETGRSPAASADPGSETARAPLRPVAIKGDGVEMNFEMKET